MDHVLAISLQEEEVHSRIVETEDAITKLQELMQRTQEQLTKRINMKCKVLLTSSNSRGKYIGF